MKPRTIIEKIWDQHVVAEREAAPALLYIDLHLVHEVTSPQAFDGLRKRGIKVRRPDLTIATTDHSTPTTPRGLPILDQVAAAQVAQLEKNCEDFGIRCYGLSNERQGIVHVMGPEQGLTQPGMTVVCGDSHTATHGAFGALAFGIGTSEVEHVLATQCLLQRAPKTFAVRYEGSLKPGVTAKTTGQKKYLDAIRKHDITFGIGPAGTGKTYLAVAMALSAMREGRVSRIILTRPAVEAGEALGFLPGDLLEKITPYLRPLHDALQDMMPADEIVKLTERGTIEIAPLAYMRGRTLNNAFVILDEAQNATSEQMLMFLTRMGFDSKVVITGDITQVDLPGHKTSGLIEVQGVLKGIPGLEIAYFDEHDVVRHELVQKIIAAYSKFKEERERRRQETTANGTGKPPAA